MANYRRRLEQDLDGWIGRGLVPAESRAAILDSVGEARRLDASTALAIMGGSPQTYTDGAVVTKVWMQNAAYIWVPFILAATVAATVPIRRRLICPRSPSFGLRERSLGKGQVPGRGVLGDLPI